MPESVYEIGRFSGTCAATGAALKPGDQFVATLVEVDEGGALARFDYSAKGWESGPRPKRLFACWHAVVPSAETARRPSIDTPALLALFEELAGADDPRRIALRYFVALMLVRRRVLQMVGERRVSDVILVRPKGADPDDAPTEVSVPALDAAALEQTAEQFQRLMGIEA